MFYQSSHPAGGELADDVSGSACQVEMALRAWVSSESEMSREKLFPRCEFNVCLRIRAGKIWQAIKFIRRHRRASGNVTKPLINWLLWCPKVHSDIEWHFSSQTTRERMWTDAYQRLPFPPSATIIRNNKALRLLTLRDMMDARKKIIIVLWSRCHELEDGMKKSCVRFQHRSANMELQFATINHLFMIINNLSLSRQKIKKKKLYQRRWMRNHSASNLFAALRPFCVLLENNYAAIK